jgi:hypothetical protein
VTKTSDKSATKPPIDSPVTPTASPSVSPSSNPDESKKPVEQSAVEPQVNENPTQVAFIERKLRREISQKWEDRKGIPDKLEYTLTADQEGKLVSYAPKNAVAESKKDIIPLPKMVTADTEKVEPDQAPAKKTANFTVSFTPNGAIEIKRDKLLAGNPTNGKAIADTEQVKSLAKDIESKVKLAAAPTFTNDLIYRVAADESGAIVDYNPINGAAFDHEKETPLPVVTKYDAAAASGEKPLAQYIVTYRPDGKVDIKPR